MQNIYGTLCDIDTLLTDIIIMRSARIEQLYVVQRIIGKKMEGGKLYYRIKWQGYPESQATWEKLSHLRYVEEMVRDYDKTLSCSSIDSINSINSSAQLPSNNTSSSDIDSLQNTNKQVSMEKNDTFSQGRKGDEVSNDSLDGKEKKRSEKEKSIDSGVTKVAKDRQGKASKEEKRRVKKLSKRQKQAEKQVERQEKQPSSNKPDNEAEKKAIKEKPQKQVMVKGEETEQPQIRIRLIVSEGDSDIHDYYVQYPNGRTKVFQTCEMFYAHPVEFVNYLEKRTLIRNKK